MPELCRSCERKDIDFGGCRCQALLLAGNAAATDPTCSKSPTRGVVEQILAQVPTVETPVKRGDDYVEDDEGERVKQHNEAGFELNGREGSPIYLSHIAADV